MEIGAYIEQQRSTLEAWGNFIVGILRPVSRGRLKVEASYRVKDPISARIKQIRKGYADPTKEMTDLVGARFVVLTEDDLSPLRNFIESCTEWNAIQSRDPLFERHDRPDSFGYQSHHYELRPAAPKQLGAIVVDQHACCEVQIRTLLQHAYAELTHDSLYKPVQTVPSQAERLVARSMALMETTDELLSRALAAIRDANAPAASLAEAAESITGARIDGDSKLLFDLLAQEFTELISMDSGRALSSFTSDHSFVLDRISERAGRGLFEFPAVSLVAFWLASSLETDIRARWPLPGSTDELESVLADLGIGGPVR